MVPELPSIGHVPRFLLATMDQKQTQWHVAVNIPSNAKRYLGAPLLSFSLPCHRNSNETNKIHALQNFSLRRPRGATTVAKIHYLLNFTLRRPQDSIEMLKPGGVPTAPTIWF
eukprot:1884786-Lingulodinium_polyedra.AAC.1